MNGNLARSGFEHIALDFNDIAEIPGFKFFKSVLADIIHSHIGLNSAVSVLHINEIGLAHIAPCHNSAGDNNILVFKRFKIRLNIIRVVGLRCKRDFKRILAAFLQSPELIYPDLLLFVFGKHNLGNSHGSCICVITYKLDIFKSLGLCFGRACAGNGARLKKESVFYLIAVLLNKKFGVCFFFIARNSVLHLHTAVFLNCFYASFALILFLKNG